MLLCYGDMTPSAVADRGDFNTYTGPPSGGAANQAARAGQGLKQPVTTHPDYREWSKAGKVSGLLKAVAGERKVGFAVSDGKVHDLLPKTFGAGTVFFAKDKDTLARGFGLIGGKGEYQVASWMTTSRSTARQAPANASQLSWFSGSYGTGTSVLLAGVDAMIIKTVSGADLGEAYRAMKNLQLFNRGYYLVVGPSSEMTDVKKKTTQIGSSMSLMALGSLLLTRKLSDDDVNDQIDKTFGFS